MECSICLEEYDICSRIPRVLTRCGHTVCDTCANSLRDTRISPESLQCPHCRAFTPLSEVRTNFAVAAMIGDVIGNIPKHDKGMEVRGNCTTHPTETVSLFCVTCFQFICSKCYETWDQPHSKHSRVSYDEGLKLVQVDIERLDKSLLSHMEEAEAQMAHVQASKDKVIELKGAAVQHFQHTVAQMKAELDAVLNALTSYEVNVHLANQPLYNAAVSMRDMHQDLENLRQSCLSSSNGQIFEYYAANRSGLQYRVNQLLDADTLNRSLDRVSIGQIASPPLSDQPPQLVLHAPQNVSLFSLRLPYVTGREDEHSTYAYHSASPPMRPIHRKTSNDNINT